MQTKKLSFDVKNDYYRERLFIRYVIHALVTIVTINYMTELPLNNVVAISAVIVVIYMALDMYVPTVKFSIKTK